MKAVPLLPLDKQVSLSLQATSHRSRPLESELSFPLKRKPAIVVLHLRLRLPTAEESLACFFFLRSGWNRVISWLWNWTTRTVHSLKTLNLTEKVPQWGGKRFLLTHCEHPGSLTSSCKARRRRRTVARTIDIPLPPPSSCHWAVDGTFLWEQPPEEWSQRSKQILWILETV